MNLAAFSPTVEYDSDKVRSTAAWHFLELLRYRDLLRLLVSRTIKTRYKRSVLGVAWTLLNPLVNMVVMSIAFSALFHAAAPNYPVYVLVGLVVWTFFSQTTAYAMGTLLWGGGLLKRIYVPPMIFAVACVANGLINLVFSLVPLVLMMVFLGHPFHATWLYLPVSVALVAVFCLGVSLLISTWSVFFTDFLDMYQLFLQAWFFLTPIIYPREVVPERFAWVLAANPMTHFVDLFRMPLYLGRIPDAGTVAVCAAWAAAAFLFGSWVFARKAHELAYTL
jgi:ABC-type polysaccharide/polyol phosphate export permease